MGLVAQLFTVVRPVLAPSLSSHPTPDEIASPIGYRISTFRRVNLKESGPPSPLTYVFSTAEAHEFLLIKHFNGLMMTRVSLPICRLYEAPRQAAIMQAINAELQSSSPSMSASTPSTKTPKKSSHLKSVSGGSNAYSLSGSMPSSPAGSLRGKKGSFEDLVSGEGGKPSLLSKSTPGNLGKLAFDDNTSDGDRSNKSDL